MNSPLACMRLLFISLCILLAIAYTKLTFPTEIFVAASLIATLLAILFGLSLIGVDWLLRKQNLRTFNLALIGLLSGYLMGEALFFIFQIIEAGFLADFSLANLLLIKNVIFLSTTYLGMVIALRTAEDIHLTIPFIHFKSITPKRKELLVDLSVLSDLRFLDLANCGLLDQVLLCPRFSLIELNTLLESRDETIKTQARRSLETLRRLEELPFLKMRYIESSKTDSKKIEGKDFQSRLVALAKELEANILCADASSFNQNLSEGVRLIDLNFLTYTTKPALQSGEVLPIKVQRYGKEPRQGVGYLDDGTMVVINGGADFIGETIKTHVLSIKQTSSGRLIFCNAESHALSLQEPSEESNQKSEPSFSDLEGTHKKYFIT